MNTFAERLKELRIEKGIPQRKFAPLIGYGQQTVSTWECGQNEPTASAIIACAKFFDVTTDYLLGLENDDGSKTRD